MFASSDGIDGGTMLVVVNAAYHLGLLKERALRFGQLLQTLALRAITRGRCALFVCALQECSRALSERLTKLAKNLMSDHGFERAGVRVSNARGALAKSGSPTFMAVFWACARGSSWRVTADDCTRFSATEMDRAVQTVAFSRALDSTPSLRVLHTHLESGRSRGEMRECQIRQLRTMAATYSNDELVLLLGDLNDRRRRLRLSVRQWTPSGWRRLSRTCAEITHKRLPTGLTDHPMCRARLGGLDHVSAQQGPRRGCPSTRYHPCPRCTSASVHARVLRP